MFDIKDFWVTLIGLQNIFVTTIVRIGNTNMKLMKKNCRYRLQLITTIVNVF